MVAFQSQSIPITLHNLDEHWNDYSESIEKICVFEIQNRIFDILFKEDVDCQVNGHLHYLLRGNYGMDKLCAYLNNIDWAEPNLPLDLIKIKLDHIIEEMIFLMFF